MKIKRSVFNGLASQITDQKISILIGPRQVGKTFLLHELSNQVKKMGKNFRYFDLEQPDDILALGKNDKMQFDTLTSSGDVVFIDELHLLKNISHIFKAIYDSNKKIKIFASGSSALEMHKHLKESLAGRVIFNKIFPLNLAELKQIKSYKDESILLTGAMPGLVHCLSDEEKIEELQTIVSTYINRDIKGLIKEENIRAFNHLIFLLAEKQGSVVVSANLSNEIGVSKPTVEKYLEILSHTYVCHPVYSYAKNLGNELKKSKKYYLYDLGIRNSLLKNFAPINKRKDFGFLNESFVLLSIIKQLKANMEVRFWRTKHGDEIDFIILKNQIPFPIEVKSDLKKLEIPKGIKKFLDNYPDAEGAIVFNNGLTDKISYSNRTIYFQKWQKAEEIEYLKTIY